MLKVTARDAMAEATRVIALQSSSTSLSQSLAPSFSPSLPPSLEPSLVPQSDQSFSSPLTHSSLKSSPLAPGFFSPESSSPHVYPVA